MATNTSHLGLVKPAYTDAADVAVINNNMDTIDTAISHILPVITGSTNNSGYTIATGHYFEANGSVYKATASIGTGSSWSGSASALSGTALNEAFDSLSSNIGALTKHEFNGNVTLSTTNYTTPVDGYFTITIAAGLGRNVYGYINDQLAISIRGQSGDTGFPTAGIFVKKGMRIKVSEAVPNESGGLFYPLAL